jgi:hypothetical protein
MALLSVLKINAESGCMHVKCKFVDTIKWNNFARIKFHFYHLATILRGFFLFLYINEKVFYNFNYYIIDENVQMSSVVFFQFKI